MLDRTRAPTGYEYHPDVVWGDKVAQKAHRGTAHRHRMVDTGRDPSPAPSLALPATMIDRTVGLCLCWLCMPRPMTRQDQDWMFDVLAKHALAMPEVDRRIWVQDWTLRHGDFAGAVLKRHMDKFTAIEKG